MSRERALVLRFVTDKSTPEGAKKGCTAGKAIVVCDFAGGCVDIIGGVTSLVGMCGYSGVVSSSPFV